MLLSFFGSLNVLLKVDKKKNCGSALCSCVQYCMMYQRCRSKMAGSVCSLIHNVLRLKMRVHKKTFGKQLWTAVGRLLLSRERYIIAVVAISRNNH